MKLLVFTDMDGTLIDHDTYSWENAQEAIGILKEKKIPIIPCTSKTRAEIEKYRKEIGLQDPFISENGAAIFIPKNYFDFDFDCRDDGKYDVIEFGTPYEKLREVLKNIEKECSVEIKGFGDMSPEELSKDSGLSLEEAKLARSREYDEAFKTKDLNRVIAAISSKGLNYTAGGRYAHIMGDNDKGRAVKHLAKLYEKEGNVKTVGLGDSLNDLPMLQVVDHAFLMRKTNNKYDERVNLQNVKRTEGIGPEGWNEAILSLL